MVVTLYFTDNTYQVVKTTSHFDSKYLKEMCSTIANGRPYSLKPYAG